MGAVAELEGLGTGVGKRSVGLSLCCFCEWKSPLLCMNRLREEGGKGEEALWLTLLLR